MSTNVSLIPELESFAKACVEEGRYNNVSEVVREALRRLQDAEQRRKEFNFMLDEVYRDVEENGTISLDDALDNVDRTIEASSR
jgi:antitoxin ParD1/3/4